MSARKDANIGLTSNQLRTWLSCSEPSTYFGWFVGDSGGMMVPTCATDCCGHRTQTRSAPFAARKHEAGAARVCCRLHHGKPTALHMMLYRFIRTRTRTPLR